MIMQNFINSNHPAKGIPRVYTQEVLAWISLCINGWTKLIQIRRKHHNIKISIFFKYFNTLQMSNSHSKSENVTLLGQNLQLI
jgi:hypothetical protein